MSPGPRTAGCAFVTQDGPVWRKRPGWTDLTPHVRAAMRERCQRAAMRMRANEEARAREATQALAAAVGVKNRPRPSRARRAMRVLAGVALGLGLAWAIAWIAPRMWALLHWEWFYI